MLPVKAVGFAMRDEVVCRWLINWRATNIVIPVVHLASDQLWQKWFETVNAKIRYALAMSNFGKHADEVWGNDIKDSAVHT